MAGEADAGSDDDDEDDEDDDVDSDEPMDEVRFVPQDILACAYILHIRRLSFTLLFFTQCFCGFLCRKIRNNSPHSPHMHDSLSHVTVQWKICTLRCARVRHCILTQLMTRLATCSQTSQSMLRYNHITTPTITQPIHEKIHSMALVLKLNHYYVFSPSFC